MCSAGCRISNQREALQRTERYPRESWNRPPENASSLLANERQCAHSGWLARNDLIQALAGLGTWKISRTWTDGRRMTAHGGSVFVGNGPTSIKGSVGTNIWAAQEGHDVQSGEQSSMGFASGHA